MHDSHPPQLQQSFERLRAAWLDQRPSYEQRRDDLKRLRRLFRERLDEMSTAVSADFGHRSVHETLLGEGSVVLSEIDHTLARLKAWMKPERRAAGWKLWPAKAHVRFVPLGVVGVISPWNYPVNLALAPLVAAIGAGNHVLLKPSEHTPRTSEFLRRLIADVFPQTRATVVLGGADLSAAFSALPFDHLFFTGSTAVGRKVMAAAAQNLTPVTLELGGKSPVIVGESADLRRAADRIATGKFFNAGQTCIAPDYVLIHESKRDAFVSLLRQQIGERYGVGNGYQDYTSIINDAQHDRLAGLVSDARARGHALIPLLEMKQASPSRVRLMEPTVVLEPTQDSAVMREEIFGPILPVISYRTTDEAINHVLGRDRPLALYCFSADATEIEAILARIVAGGVCINDTLYQFACNDMPFGGVGASGMGAYHGEFGFQTFSKMKPVFHQSGLNGLGLFKPPYGKTFERMLKLLAR